MVVRITLWCVRLTAQDVGDVVGHFEKCLGGNEESRTAKGIHARLHLGSERFVITVWPSSSTPKYTVGDLKTYFHTKTHTRMLIAA